MPPGGGDEREDSSIRGGGVESSEPSSQGTPLAVLTCGRVIEKRFLMGRRPKSTNRKRIEGNPGRRPLNPDEPIAKVGLPKAQSFLCGEARRFYYRLGKQLVAEKRMAVVYQPTFVVLCLAWGWVAKATLKLEDEGAIVTTPTGFVRVSPWLDILTRSEATVLKASSEFGISPTSQAKAATVKSAATVTKLQAFIDRKRRTKE